MSDLKTDPATDPRPAPARAGRGIKVVLALSLALNLAVAGMVAGAFLKSGGPAGMRHHAVRDLNFGPFTDALTRDQRRAMLRNFTAQGPGLRDMRAQMRADYDAVVAAVTGQPFDAAALEAAFAAQSDRLSSRLDTGRKALVDLISGMSDAERAAFAERLERALSDRQPRGPDSRP